MRKLLLFSIFCYTFSLVGQNDNINLVSSIKEKKSTKNELIFDAKKRSFITSDIKEKLKIGDTLNIYAVNFNPFLYTYKVNKKVINNSDKLLPFIVGLGKVGGGSFSELMKTVMKEEIFSINKDKGSTVTRQDPFIKEFKLYIDLYIEIKKINFNCSKIRELSNNIKEINLVDSYLKSTTPPKELTIQQVTVLEVFKKNIISLFESNMDCKIKVDSHIISGDTNTIEVIFTPREGTYGFETPISIISAKKKIKVRKKIGVSFSSGIFLSNNIQQDYYIHESAPNQFIIKQEGLGNYIPGVNALAHFDINADGLELNLGSGITSDAIPHLLIGGSYKFKNSKIFVDLGYSLAYRNTLSDGLSLQKTYNSKPELKTKKVFAEGFWFGLSYKL